MAQVDEKRIAAGQKLLDAAHEFFQACRDEGQDGSVQWLTDSAGALVIFTRAEYRDRLMENIHKLPQTIHYFGEEMPSEGDDE